MRLLRLAATAIALAPALAQDESSETPSEAPQNLVLILADDLGVDLLACYGEGQSTPRTPNLDRFAEEGLLFRNAWTNPLCAPSRAAVLTGRYGFRTGVGSVGDSASLPLSEHLLPEALTGFQSAAVGKWHLGGARNLSHPNESGFGSFAGSLRGAIPDYQRWPKVVNGSRARSTTYATTDVIDEAISAMETMEEPWFLYVSLHTPHKPWHVPPASLSPPGNDSAKAPYGGVTERSGNDRKGRAMIEAMDTELGRLFLAVQETDEDALVVFMGDNGSPAQLTLPPFERTRAKGTLYEGGVNVPLIIRGPQVKPGESPALVNSVDLFATLAECANCEVTTDDSRSLVPCFKTHDREVRETVYAERFSSMKGKPPYAGHVQAIRDARYKLLRTDGSNDLLFDLQEDPFETQNLLEEPTDAARKTHAELGEALAELMKS